MNMGKKNNLYLTITVDSEWSSQNDLLTYQIGVSKSFEKPLEIMYLYYNPKYIDITNYEPENLLKAFGVEKEKVKIVFLSLENLKEENGMIMEDVISRIIEAKLIFTDIDLVFFYSIRDLYYLFNQEFILSLLKKNFPKDEVEKNNFICKKNAHFGSFLFCQINIHLKDPSGLNKRSLDDLLATCAIKNPFKNTLTKKQKSCMEIFAKESTNVFLDYAISDVISLSMVPNSMCQNINLLLNECYGFEGDELFTPKNLPMTIGSTVSATFENYLTKQFPEDFSELSYKIAIPVNILTKRSKYKPKLFKKGTKMGKLNKKLYSSLIDAGGCRSLALGYAKSTGVLNTLITGGRCNNEQSFYYQKEFLFDFDLSSCYGSALTSFRFPIGLPTVIAKTHKDPKITLKEFLIIYGDDLVDNLYTITVSGKLSFEQDLIYSKIVDEKKLSEKILRIISENTEDEIDDGVSKVVLLRKEILYGIITSDILHALRKICSSLEWMEIYNLEVDTAIFYSKRDFVENKEEFLKKLSKKRGSYNYSVEKQGVLDERSRLWTSIEIKGFINPLLEKRKALKKKMNTPSLTPEEKFQFNGQQQTLKLLVNTLYGVFCSPYFSVSNTILANCITARARLGVWMASRPLKGFQCITDGFAYSPTDVLRLKKNNPNFKKPGLKVLSNLETIKKNFYVEKTSLGDIDWKLLFSTNSLNDNSFYQNLDQNVQQFLADFWSTYDLTIPYQVEHKLQNTGLKIE